MDINHSPGEHEDSQVLLIEGHNARYPTFGSQLRAKGVSVQACKNGKAALALLAEKQPVVIVLNAASLRSSGRRICERLKRAAPDVPLIWIVPADQPTEPGLADVVLPLPFTVRKLLNRLRPYLNPDAGQVLQAGVLKLDVENRYVTCMTREAHLTPRLVLLLQVLMAHRGEVVPRQVLFKSVWRTEYVEDTRTLDVHISWLRRAIEEDPRQPRFLKTVRGVGYLLDV